MGKVTYRETGVDLDLYAQSMARLPPLMRRTLSPRVIPLEGGFAGLFQLDFDGPLFARRYREPVLVACTDGVGTKLKVAQMAGIHDTVGIDLVAMSVNDALCCGAEPLFFLDYAAFGRDDPDLVEQLIRGIVRGCEACDCALLGGETAIMPDIYKKEDYDLAGFCVGVVERSRLIDGSAIAPGDVVLGVASSGLHSNGYSLARRIVFQEARLELGTHVDELGCTVCEELLRPTTIYARLMRGILAHYRVKNVVHGVAHITGGGLAENLARILPPCARAVLERGSWPRPRVFDWLARLGRVEQHEMERVFNMGVGLVLVVSAYYGESIRQQCIAAGLGCWPIGHIEYGDPGVAWR